MSRIVKIEITTEVQSDSVKIPRKLQDKSIVEIVEAYRFYFWKVAADVMHPAIKTKVAPSDLVQESIITALNNFDQFEGETVMEFRNWIEGIMRYKYLNLRRKHQSRQRPISARFVPTRENSVNQPNFDWVDLKSNEPLEKACQNEMAAKLRVKIKRLPEKVSDVLILKLEEDLSMATIASRLGIEESAAYKRYHRGLEQLGKQILNDPDFHE